MRGFEVPPVYVVAALILAVTIVLALVVYLVPDELEALRESGAIRHGALILLTGGVIGVFAIGFGLPALEDSRAPGTDHAASDAVNNPALSGHVFAITGRVVDGSGAPVESA